MKLSVSLTDEDVALVDDYLSRSGLKSRSAVIRRAFTCFANRIWKRTTPRHGRSGRAPVSRRRGSRPRPTGWPMLLGEVRLIHLEPVPGIEGNRRRPAVLVSKDQANAAAARLGRGVITVVPPTSNVQRVFAVWTLLPS